MVTILVTYAVGMERTLRTCLSALARHDAGCDSRVCVYSDDVAAPELNGILKLHEGVERVSMPVPEGTASFRHMYLLDEGMKREQGLVLTLDCDCFPVAPGWLSELVKLDDQGYLLPGILWPWEPPMPNVQEKDMEWKIRKYHNWDNSWVACQLVHTNFIQDFGLSYGGKVEDTGFSLIDKANELGKQMCGWMPTRCAKASYASAFDNEFNRLLCVMYGDKMFHVGGASRKVVGNDIDPSELYREAIEKTLRHRGAEWVLEEGNSHVYQFDREEEVTAYKMKWMYAGILEHLKTHESCFNS